MLVRLEMGFGYIMEKQLHIFQHIFWKTFSVQQTCFLAEYFWTLTILTLCRVPQASYKRSITVVDLFVVEMLFGLLG